MYIKKIFSKSLKFSTIFQHKFLFSSSKKLEQTLRSIQLSQNNKLTNLFESGIITSQHFNSQTKKVTISLNLSKDFRKIKNILKDTLQKQGFNDAQILLTPKQQKDKYTRKGNLLKIKKIIAVSSCKGGVGKSTIAINIAVKLKQMGYKVGIFDTDIYGPSLPTLINKQGQTLQPCQDNAKQIIPVQYQQIKCMSFGFVQNKPAVVRGPMISSIVSQMLLQTRWGQLDYLIVDMPPGTGDIQISLCQQLKFNGAIIVTTPQRLAYMDVIKGIQMFQELKVKIAGIVENMAYYKCSKCGSIDELFGTGYTKLLKQQYGIENTIKFPLLSEISKYSDKGTPLMFVLPQSHEVIKSYTQLCENVIKEVQKEQKTPLAYYNTNQRLIIIQYQNQKKKINPVTLRQMCHCAGCVDQLTGAMLLKKQKIDPEVYPVRVEPKGNYAVAMVWSDGHKSSIYPYKRLLSSQIPSV